MPYYFSLQYSAIQAAVLRHDRLWSMAGISLALSTLNEITLPSLAEKHGGTPLVAGGGKFTASFDSQSAAASARHDMVRAIATAFPMLEFQYSDAPKEAKTLHEALNHGGENGLVTNLNEQKQRLRGSALTFNPHLKVCEECGTYPAAVKKVFKMETENKASKTKTIRICAYCDRAMDTSKIEIKSILDKEEEALTTIERIYRRYYSQTHIPVGIKIPRDFKDMVAGSGDNASGGPQERSDQPRTGRMAVWFSDINSMNDKVPIWLGQEQEREIIKTFNRVKQVYINFTAAALRKTFPQPEGDHLPFRIIVAGGDDLCIVMAEKYVLDFATNLSAALKRQIGEVNKDDNHPLNPGWLAKQKAEYDLKHANAEKSQPPKPYSFGAAFVVTGIHTPFARIHQLGEELMSTAKHETNREANSINWRIMAEEDAASEDLLDFERPVFIDEKIIKVYDNPWSKLTFKEYLDHKKELETISGSHRFQIVDQMIKYKDRPDQLTRQVKILNSAETGKSFDKLFNPPFYESDVLKPGRIATVFELMSIAGNEEKRA